MSDFIYVSSNVRSVTDPIKHGCLRKINWSEKEIVASVEGVFPLHFCARSDNPRGGIRGWRGILVGEDTVVAANSDALVFYDKDLITVKKIVSHPAFGNIHGLYYFDHIIYVASTQTDLYATVDVRTMDIELFPVLEDSGVIKVIQPWLTLRGRTPKVLDIKRDYREKFFEDVSHLNYVHVLDDRVLLFLNSMNMLLQYKPTVEVIFAPDLKFKSIGEGTYLHCPHDIISIKHNPDLFLVSSSAIGTVYLLNIAKKTLKPIWVSPGSDVYGWIRGLDLVGNSLFIGTGVGKLIEVDIVSGTLISEMQVFEDWEGLPHAIFGVAHENGYHRLG